MATMLVICKEVPIVDGRLLSDVFHVGRSYWFSQRGIFFEYFKGNYKRRDNTYSISWKQFHKCFYEDLSRLVRADYPRDVADEDTVIEWCNCHYCGEMFPARFHEAADESVECPNCHSILSISERN